MENNSSVPILFPLEPGQFWSELRRIVQEEIARRPAAGIAGAADITQTPGLTQKPLYKMSEVCSLFRVSRPTVYEWIRVGKLRPVKIRSRVYFLGRDIEALLHPAVNGSSEAG